MKNEKDVKKRVREILDAHEAWWYMPAASPYGRIGVPDFIACIGGKFLAVETKFGYNTTSARQKIELANIEAAGGIALVVNEDNIGQLEELLCGLSMKSS